MYRSLTAFHDNQGVFRVFWWIVLYAHFVAEREKSHYVIVVKTTSWSFLNELMEVHDLISAFINIDVLGIFWLVVEGIGTITNCMMGSLDQCNN